MATFLELCQKVHRLAGYQGTLSSVVATGYQATLVDHVANAWVDIQSLRDDWVFLKRNITLTTVIGQTEYTITDLLANPVSSIGKYRGIIDSNNSVLLNVTYDDYLLDDVANDDAGEPSKYAIHPTTQSVWINPPDAVYNLDVHYYRKPFVMSKNTDVPLVQSNNTEAVTLVEYAIVYQAVVDFGIFMDRGGLYHGYNAKANAAIGSLMREQCPAKRIRVGGIV